MRDRILSELPGLAAAVSGLTVLVLIYRAGLLSDTPLWFYLAVGLGSVVCNGVLHGLIQRDRVRGAVSRHAIILMTVAPAATIQYAMGWGPLMPVVYVTVGTLLLQEISNAGTRSILPSIVGVTVVGEVAVANGWCPSALTPMQSHGFAVLAVLAFIGAHTVFFKAHQTIAASERHITQLSEQFQALVANSVDPISLVSPDGMIETVSPSMGYLTGRPVEEVIGTPLTEFLVAPDRPAVQALTQWDLVEVAQAVPRTATLRLMHTDGTLRILEATASPVTAGDTYRVALNLHDATARYELEERLRYEATHDPLTGLLNRKGFGVDAERAVAWAHRECESAGLLYIDLDGFKHINDHYGHEHGDAVIVAVGQRLREWMTPHSVAARLGGDEFAVVFAGLRTREELLALAKAIRHSIREPISTPSGDVTVDASIGLSFQLADDLELERLVSGADQAMYVAKDHGKGTFQWASDEPIDGSTELADGTGSDDSVSSTATFGG